MDNTLISKKFFVTILALILIIVSPFVSKDNVGAMTTAIVMVSVAFIGGQAAVDAVIKYKSLNSKNAQPINVNVTPEIKITKEVVPVDPTPEETPKK
jgi:hypothetical protein